VHSVGRQQIHMELEQRGKRARLKQTVDSGARGLELSERNTCGEEDVHTSVGMYLPTSMCLVAQ